MCFYGALLLHHIAFDCFGIKNQPGFPKKTPVRTEFSMTVFFDNSFSQCSRRVLFLSRSDCLLMNQFITLNSSRIHYAFNQQKKSFFLIIFSLFSIEPDLGGGGWVCIFSLLHKDLTLCWPKNPPFKTSILGWSTLKVFVFSGRLGAKIH